MTPMLTPLPVPRIDGHINDSDIVNCFKEEFKTVYASSNLERDQMLKKNFEKTYETHRNDNICAYLLTWAEMCDILKSLKSGKAYAGFIKAEHLQNAPSKLFVHMHLLFNSLTFLKV